MRFVSQTALRSGLSFAQNEQLPGARQLLILGTPAPDSAEGRWAGRRRQVESGMAVAAKDYIGRVLSGYRLVALLGAGGAGAVFLGERVDDPSIQRAIKILLPDDDLPAL